MEIIALCNKHQDCEFTVVTDGEGIDEEFCRQILRVKNLFVTLKVKDTVMDERLSGKTDLMRRMKIPYAVSCLYLPGPGAARGPACLPDLLPAG